VARAAFYSAGQKCTATSRVIVEESIAREFASISSTDASGRSDVLPPRIADHPRTASNKRDGPVPGALQMGKPHHWHETTYMEAWGRGVEPHVAAHFARCECVGQTVRVLVDHTAPGQLVQQRGCPLMSSA